VVPMSPYRSTLFVAAVVLTAALLAGGVLATPPVISSRSATPPIVPETVALTIDATWDDSADAPPPNCRVDGAEWWLDPTDPGPGNGHLMNTQPNLGCLFSFRWLGSPQSVGMGPGNYMICLRAWGQSPSGSVTEWSVKDCTLPVVVTAGPGPDTQGPECTAISVVPNPANQMNGYIVDLSFNYDDTLRGGSNISDAEYFVTPPDPLPIQNGSGRRGWTNSPPFGSVSVLTAQRNGLDVSTWAPGNYDFRSHGMDSGGYWGAGTEGPAPPAQDVCLQTLQVEAPSSGGGPSVTSLQLNPNPAVQGTDFSTHLSGVASTTSMVDVITAAEYFPGPPGPAGSGIPTNATDGLYDEATEDIQSDVQIAGWAPGSYPLNVHAQTTVWGPFSQITLTINSAPVNQPPTITVTWPNGGERLSGNTNQGIMFSAGDPDDPPASVNVTFEISRDNGLNWIPLPGATTALSTGFPWMVTCPPTTSALIRGTAQDPSGLKGGDASNSVFAIDCSPPAISAVNPSNASVSVPQNSDVRVTFNETMNVLSAQGAFTLVNADSGAPVSGAFSWSGGNSVMVFNPPADLLPCTNYTVAVSTSARDSSTPGLTLVTPWSSGFRTGGPGWCAARVLTRIVILPSGPLNVLPLATVPFTAKGYNDDTSVNTSWTSSWSLQNGRGTLSSPPVWDGTAKVWQVTYSAPRNNLGWENVTVNGGGKSNKTAVHVITGPATRVALFPATVADQAPGATLSFNARAYDAQDNIVPLWSPVWSVDGPGTITPTGGTGASGYTAAYTARMTPGVENVTVVINGTAITDSTAITVVASPPPDPLVRIELVPADPFSMQVGTSAVFTAIGFSQSGNQNVSWVPSWSVSGGTLMGNGGDATVGFTATFQAGTISGLGQVRVLSGPIENTTAITLRPGPIVTIVVSPVAVILQPLQTRDLLAHAWDIQGNLNLSWVGLPSLDAAVGTMSNSTWDASNGWRWTFTAATGLGSATLTVTAAGVSSVSGVSGLIVESGPLDHITVTPASITLNIGSAQTFSAQAFDAWDHLNTTWSPAGWSSGSGLGTLGSFGGTASSGFTAVYTATIAGDDTVLVSKSAKSGQAAVHNTARAGPLASLEISPWPGPTIVNPGDTVAVSALGFDASHNLNTSWLPVWSTTDAAGSLGNLGGSAATGFTATYVAGPTPGPDNVVVSAVGASSVSNRTAMQIAISGPLSRVEITPGTLVYLEIAGSLEFTAKGYDASDVLNTTWTPSWNLTPAVGVLSSIREVSPGEHRAVITRTTVGLGVLTARDSLTTVEDTVEVDHIDIPPISAAGPLPTLLTTRAFSVPYVASDEGGSGLLNVELWYRFDGNAWVLYATMSGTSTDPVAFTAGQDGLYEFYTRARDNAGNLEAAPATPDAFVTIDATAPHFLGSSPTAGASDVPVEQPIRLIFSEPVDLTSLQTAALVVADGASVPGVWSLAGGTATFTPVVPLPGGATITISLTPGVSRDLAGNPMTDLAVVSFQTAGSTRGTGIVSGSPFLGPLMAVLALFLVLVTFLIILWTRRRREHDGEHRRSPKVRRTTGTDPEDPATESTSDENAAAPGAAQGTTPGSDAAATPGEPVNGNGNGHGLRRLLRPVPKKK